MAAIVPAVVLRLSGWRTGPVIDNAVFGTAVLAAGFMLSWDAEAAETRISQGPILALVTVLPEYAGGKAPESNYVHYAAVNMTGANRLLFGVAWPLMAILHWLRTRQRGIAMATVNVVEICFQPRGCRQGSGLGLSIVHRVVERAPWKLRPQIRRALSAVNRAARPAATARGREGNNVRAMRPTTSATRRARGQAGWR